MDPRTGFLPPSPATWDVAARVVSSRPKRRKPRAGSQAHFPTSKPGFLQNPTFAMPSPSRRSLAHRGFRHGRASNVPPRNDPRTPGPGSCSPWSQSFVGVRVQHIGRVFAGIALQHVGEGGETRRGEGEVLCRTRSIGLNRFTVLAA